MSSDSLPDQLIFHGNGGTYPPHGVITPDDHGPYVVVTTWIFTCLAVLSVIARFGTRRSPDVDNIIVFVAIVLGIIQSVTIHLAVNHGLGRHRENINDTNFNRYGKALYASRILQITVICLTKISLIIVYKRLTPLKKSQITFALFITFVALWGAATVLALAFQCRVPHPWNLTPNRCFNQGALFYSSGTIDVLTDVAIIILSVIIVWGLHMRRAEKWAVVSIFGTRALVCIANIFELQSLRAYLQSADQTWSITITSVWSQAVVGLSIITACIPLLKPFLTMLQFSLIDSSIPYGPNMYQLNSKEQNSGSRGLLPKHKGSSSEGEGHEPLSMNPVTGYTD